MSMSSVSSVGQIISRSVGGDPPFPECTRRLASELPRDEQGWGQPWIHESCMRLWIAILLSSNPLVEWNASQANDGEILPSPPPLHHGGMQRLHSCNKARTRLHDDWPQPWVVSSCSVCSWDFLS